MRMTSLENLEKMRFAGQGRYDIPAILSEKRLPEGRFIQANAAMSEKQPEQANVHCFVYDSQIARYWNQPDRYLPILARFRSVCAPDYSLYADMPLAMQIYNHYRKHWTAAYWQAHGLTVYPTISWSTPASYDWCFDGEPQGGSVGTQKNRESRRLFIQGYAEMMRRLNPLAVIFYGKAPEECGGRIIPVKTFQQQMREGGERK